jgi:hypothetical protein
MLSIRISDAIEDELETLAKTRGLTKSDLAREAIGAFLSGHDREARGIRDGGWPDDFSEFGAALVNAHRTVLESQFKALLDAHFEDEWAALVEPTYQIFRQKVFEQNESRGQPRLSHNDTDFAFLSAPIWFANDDVQERIVPLHELVYRYVREEGVEALDHFRAALTEAERRLAAERQG